MERLGKTLNGHESHLLEASKVFRDWFSAGEPIAFQHVVDMMQVEAPSMTVRWMVFSLMIT